MATKEKINLLEVIPCRNEHIKAEQEGETMEPDRRAADGS